MNRLNYLCKKCQANVTELFGLDVYFDFFPVVGNNQGGVHGTVITRRRTIFNDTITHLKETICPTVEVRFDSDRDTHIQCVFFLGI